MIDTNKIEPPISPIVSFTSTKDNKNNYVIISTAQQHPHAGYDN
jgi:hypothetical protein